MSDEIDRFLKKAQEDFDLALSGLGVDLQNRCRHSKCIPQFDAEAAKGLDEYEIRKRYPRFDGNCPDCGALVICYASAEHYIMGDW